MVTNIWNCTWGVITYPKDYSDIAIRINRELLDNSGYITIRQGQRLFYARKNLGKRLVDTYV